MSYVCVAATDPRTEQGGETGGIPQLNFEPTLKALGMFWSALFLFSLHSLQSKWEENTVDALLCTAQSEVLVTDAVRNYKGDPFVQRNELKYMFILPQLNMVLDHWSGGSGSHSLESP